MRRDLRNQRSTKMSLTTKKSKILTTTENSQNNHILSTAYPQESTLKFSPIHAILYHMGS